MLKREILWEPGFDHRNDPQKKQYGCHGLQIRWLVHGDKGSVQFLLYTGWLPTWDMGDHSQLFVMPADLGYHADEPQYEDQTTMECAHRPSGKCYYDGSSLNAEKPFKILLTEGEEALWQFLEEYYRTIFEGEK